MKKIFLVISFLIIVLALSACNKDSNMTDNTTLTTPTQIPVSSPTSAPTSHDIITVTPVPDNVSITEVPNSSLDHLIKDNPVENDNSIKNSENASQEADNESHLEYYDEFDEYNSSREEFKGFILSEVWIDGAPYYQLLNEVNDIKIVVDETQENAIIYHDGKSLDYDMGYLFDVHGNAGIDLCDVTGDEKVELIIYHDYTGFGTYDRYCDVINLSTMTQYDIGQYFDQLCSKITVEPIKIIEDDSFVCRTTDISGNISYGIADLFGSTNLSDYSFEASENTSCSVNANHKKKCLSVSIDITMCDVGLACSLGSINSDLILNTDTNCFELSDDFEVAINNIYTDEAFNDMEPPAPITTTLTEALKCYKDVLQNKIKINQKAYKDNYDEGTIYQPFYLDDLIYTIGIEQVGFDESWNPYLNEFAILDMDGDKIPEIVIDIDSSCNGFYEVLHYYNGKVYGFYFVYRAMESLKADGTFLGSSGAANNNIINLSFLGDSLSLVTLAYSDMTDKYFIMNEPVTKTEFETYCDKQNAKTDVTWYDFNTSNIDKLD